MTLRLYDTATRSVRDFVPREVGKVGIYLCGVTVQSPAHYGHMRSGVNYDVLRRWLRHSGYEVTFIQNITDIDDKVLASSAQTGVPWWALGYANERTVHAGYAALGCLPATYAPRATGHIPEMHTLIERLIEREHAYPAGGDVYFHVPSLPGYGALSGQRPEAMQPAEDGEARAKRDPRDFALWKAHKPAEPDTAAWPSPWGPGRPGWHIECSAMCWRYLGEEFDIHGGGTELIFPHHENELAQSKAAGFGFARYWVHHGLLNLGGEKMSKSLGNVMDLTAVFAQVRPVEARYFLLAPHYRSPVDYSQELLRDAATAYQRIEGFVRRAAERVGVEAASGPAVLCADFVLAMDDDLATPRALAAVHDLVREGNVALAEGNDTAVRGTLASVRGALGVLGLDPFDPQWQQRGPAGAGSVDLRSIVDALVAAALEQREQARARRDWAAADAIRDQLKASGVLIEDTPHGSRWTLEAAPDGGV